MKGEALAIIFVVVILVLIVGGAFTWFFVVKPREAASCKSDTQCPSYQFCSPDGKCLDYGKCVDNSSCIGSQVCDDGICAQCRTDKDCLNDPGNPICDDGKCVQCSSSKGCPNGVCDLKNKICVGCMSNSDCPKAAPYCWKPRLDNAGVNSCVICLEDSDCPSGGQCINHRCFKKPDPLTPPVVVGLPGPPPAPPAIPPRTHYGTTLKPLIDPRGDPFRHYSEYRSSW